MFFGLFNVLVSFQSYINKILIKKLNIFIIVYLNNIFIYINNLKQGYINIVQFILEVLKKYSFYTNFKKYHFYKNKVRLLGYIVLAQIV